MRPALPQMPYKPGDVATVLPAPQGSALKDGDRVVILECWPPTLYYVKMEDGSREPFLLNQDFLEPPDCCIREALAT